MIYDICGQVLAQGQLIAYPCCATLRKAIIRKIEPCYTGQPDGLSVLRLSYLSSRYVYQAGQNYQQGPPTVLEYSLKMTSIYSSRGVMVLPDFALNTFGAEERELIIREMNKRSAP